MNFFVVLCSISFSCIAISCNNDEKNEDSCAGSGCASPAVANSLNNGALQNSNLAAGELQVFHTTDTAGIAPLTSPIRTVTQWLPQTSSISGTTSGILFAHDTTTSIAGKPPAAPDLQYSGKYLTGADTNRFVLSTYNLGAVASTAAGWPIHAYTGWKIAGPVRNTVNGQATVNQVSYDNIYDTSANAKSALQASGLAFGAYINSDNAVGEANVMRATYGYDYASTSAPKVLSPSKSALLIEVDLGLKTYIKASPAAPSQGNCSVQTVFLDPGTNKKLTVVTRIFDSRGFQIPGAASGITNSPNIGNAKLIENIVINNNQAIVFSHLGHFTKYVWMEKDSEISQTTPWGTDANPTKHFAYIITQTQLLGAITDANNMLGANAYSTAVGHYKLLHVDVRIEGTNFAPKSNASNKLEMGFMGNNLKVSTIAWPTTNRGNAMWSYGITSVSAIKSVGTPAFPGLSFDKFQLGISNLGAFGDALSSLVPWNDSLTGWKYPGPGANQLAVAPPVNGISHSAIQAKGHSWGAYMNSVDWMSPTDLMSIRIGYDKPDTNVGKTPSFSGYPFNSTIYGSNPSILVELDWAITKYNGETTAFGTDPLGYSIINVYFQEMLNIPGQRNKVVVLTPRLFSPRGFRPSTDLGKDTEPDSVKANRIGLGMGRENASQCGTGEIGVGTHIGPGTTYITMEPNSDTSFTTASATSKHFAFRFSKSQFLIIINDTNTWIDKQNLAHAGDSNYIALPKYSTDVDKYRINLADAGMEVARLSAESKTNKKIEMAFYGSNLRVSTVYKH